MKRAAILIFGFVFSCALYAQSVDDALRYSQNTYDITARSTAMGSAFGALGGDFSSVSINPGGLGVYRSSEFLFTPGLGVTTVNSAAFSENNTSFYVSNVSLVASIDNSKSDDWKFLNFGFGFNRTNDYNRDYVLQNKNSNSSLTDFWAVTANSEGVTNSSARLPRETYLVIFDEDDDKYYSVLSQGDRVDQQKVFSEEGSSGELAISLAANFRDKLFIGGSIGITSFKYEITTNYNETVVASSDETELDYFDFEERFSIKGVGANLKLGAIFKPIHQVRLGAAVHTPSFYRIEDTYGADISSKFLNEDSDGNDTYEYGLSDNTYTYNFVSPWKFIFSLAGLYEDKGAISFDVDITNYSNARFDDPDDKDYYDGTATVPGVNKYISRELTDVINFRVGSEYNITNDISFRAGYGRYGNPFNTKNKDVKDVDLSYSVYSTGVGYKNKKFSLDIGWQMIDKISDFTRMYGSDDLPLNRFETTKHQAKISFGWRF